MDIDNLMSDPAQPYTASQDQAAETHNSGPAVWDAKVYREEVANIKSRLTDQKFKTSECFWLARVANNQRKWLLTDW